MIAGLKRCGRCKRYRQIADFAKDSTMRGGVRARCRECERARRVRDVLLNKLPELSARLVFEGCGGEDGKLCRLKAMAEYFDTRHKAEILKHVPYIGYELGEDEARQIGRRMGLELVTVLALYVDMLPEGAKISVVQNRENSTEFSS